MALHFTILLLPHIQARLTWCTYAFVATGVSLVLLWMQPQVLVKYVTTQLCTVNIVMHLSFNVLCDPYS